MKKFILGCLFLLLGVNMFSFNVHAETIDNELSITQTDGKLVIKVESDEELQYVSNQIEKNNKTVEELWKKALQKAENEQNLNKNGDIIKNSRISETYYSANAYINNGLFDFRGYHGLTGYTQTYSNGNKVFSRYTNISLVPSSGNISISGINNNVVILDGSRTYAVRTSTYVTINSGSSSSTKPLELYTEFYASGGAYNYPIF